MDTKEIEDMAQRYRDIVDRFHSVILRIEHAVPCDEQTCTCSLHADIVDLKMLVRLWGPA